MRVQLEPKRDALLALLRRRNLAGDGATDISVPVASLANQRLTTPQPSRAQIAIGSMLALCIVAGVLFLVIFFVEMDRDDRAGADRSGASRSATQTTRLKGYPKVSPFAAVRWDDFRTGSQTRRRMEQTGFAGWNSGG